MRIAMVPYPLI